MHEATISSRERNGETAHDALARINIGDMLDAFGLQQVQIGRSILEALCKPAAGWFARVVLRYDRVVGEQGLAAGGQWVLDQFRTSLRVIGQDHVPRHGPVLLLSNHPGMTDTVALFAAIPRPDLRVIAADRPFLRALPNTGRYLIYVDDKNHVYLNGIRQSANHLRGGGAVLTFPAGEIEPDPLVLDGAAQSLQRWSRSIDLFARLTPELQIVPVLVSGVLSAPAQRNPLTYLRQRRKDREKMAAMLQLVIPVYRPTQVQLVFGAPLSAGALANTESGQVTEAVAAAMLSLLQEYHPDGRLVRSAAA
jgi:hypothetical protein